MLRNFALEILHKWLFGYMSACGFILFGGGGKGGDAPDAPDYVKLAQLDAQNQQKLLEQQTIANRVNQYGPLGSITYTRDNAGGFDQAGYDRAMAAYQKAMQSYSSGGGAPPLGTVPFRATNSMATPTMAAPNMPTRDQFTTQGSGQWSQNTTLSPEMQAILDQNLSSKDQSYQQLQQALGNINSNNLPLAAVNAGETAQDAILRRVNPQLDIQENQLRQRLVNQGLRPGTPAWDREMTLMNQSRNDATSQAALQGINVANDARARAMAEQGIPINLINAYLSGGQAQMPQFQSVPMAGQGQAADLLGAGQAQYGAQLNNYNAQQAAGANTMQGLFGLGAAIGGAPSGSLFGAIGSGIGSFFGF